MWIDPADQALMNPAEAAAMEWSAPRACATALPPAVDLLFAKDDHVSYRHTEHFVIAYLTEGEHAVSGDEYLDSLASLLEQAHRAFRDGLGMLAPPAFSDSTDPAFGKIPVTPWNAPPGIGGLAGALEYHGECPHSAVPRIAIDSKLSPKGTVIRLITAHEVFHGFQYARNRFASGGSLMFESTARWSEIVAHPDLFTSWGIQGHFNEPYRYLLAPGDFSDGDRFQYGRAIWWYFLDELLGFPVAPLFWERQCADEAESEDVLRALLNENGFTLEDAFYLFTEYNLFTGPRNVGRHYARADDLPLIWFQKQHRKGESGPFAIAEDQVAERLAANYVKFHGPATRAHLKIVFRGDAALDGNRRVMLAGTTSTGSYEVRDFVLQNGSGSATLHDWARFEHVVLVVMNGDFDEEQDSLRAYEYEIHETGDEVWDMNWLPSDLTRLRTAPNPFALGTSIRFRAEGNEPVRADVYDIRGRRVARLVDGMYPQGEHAVTWHGRADSGEKVGAGKYFLRVEQGSWTETRSLVITR